MDLISRKAAIEALGERPENWTDTPAEIEAVRSYDNAIDDLKSVPSVPAVPLEMISKKLGSLCKPCMFQTVGCPYKSFDCDSCNTSDAWEKAIRKWMEEQDAQKEI